MAETLLVLLAAGFAVVPSVALLKGRTIPPATQSGGAVFFAIAFSLLVAAAFQFAPAPRSKPAPQAEFRPTVQPEGGYVGSEACRACHAHQFETWHNSFHRTMTQAAGPESVIGDFNDVRLRGVDLDVRLFRQDGGYFAELTFQNPPGRSTHSVVMTTGSHHRQAYWLGTADGSRLLMLPYMFVRAESRWIPRHSGYINPMCLLERPERGVFERDMNRWTAVCMNCHATRGTARPNNEAAKANRGRVSEAQVAEMGISCEACHGPGDRHVQANANPARRYELHLKGEADPTIVNPARLPHDRASEVCGQCHSVSVTRDDDAQRRWVHEGHTYKPGDVLANDPIRAVVRGPREKNPPDRHEDWKGAMDDGSFWSDGMYRASGREYNGLVESPCFERGTMSCSSCHRMHQQRGDARPRAEWADDQLAAGMGGNAACTQCHPKFGDAAALAAHTHHAADSPGSLCYNCHMPFTTYGITKSIRSHQVNSPTVQASLATGRPNACNQCHLDKTLEWAAQGLKRWWNVPVPELSSADRSVAASVNGILGGDAGQRAIWAWSYGWVDARRSSGSQWQAPFLAQLLDDRYDAVRLVAWRSLKTLDPFQTFAYDFVAPKERRTEAAKVARQQWDAAPKAGLTFPRGVLIDGNGTINETEFRRIWERRDDRPMSINE